MTGTELQEELEQGQRVEEQQVKDNTGTKKQEEGEPETSKKT
jgi:hypothetical protein